MRIVGKYGGTLVSDDVGKRGSGVKVTIGQQDTPTPTPTPAQQFQPVNITTQTLKMTGLREELTARLNLKISDSSSSTTYISNAKVTVKNNSASENTPQYNSTLLTNTSGTAIFRDLKNGGTYDLHVEYVGCQDSVSQYTLPGNGDANHEISIDCGTVSIDITQPVAISPKSPIKPIKVDSSRTINLDLTSFKLGDGNKFQNARYNVPIEYTSTGLTPAFYRASPCPIRNAEWKPINQNSAPTTNLLKDGKIKYCFQLKSSINIESNIKERRYFVKLVERTFGSGANPIEYAKQKGFKFGARDLIADSTCYIDFTTETLGWNFSKDVKCKYQLFSGRKLNYPWKVKEVRIIRKTALGTDIISSTANNDDAVNFIRKPSGDSLNFTFTIEDTANFSTRLGDGLPPTAPDHSATGLKIHTFEYVLLGPTGISWQDAFD